MLTLPPIVAANLDRQHKFTPQAMQRVIAYDEGEYATTLIKGRSDPAATDRMIQRVTEMTGLDPEFVKLSGGRLDTAAYLREVHREQGKLGSVYDPNVTMIDPFPYAPEQRANDPLLPPSSHRSPPPWSTSSPIPWAGRLTRATTRSPTT